MNQFHGKHGKCQTCQAEVDNLVEHLLMEHELKKKGLVQLPNILQDLMLEIEALQREVQELRSQKSALGYGVVF